VPEIEGADAAPPSDRSEETRPPPPSPHIVEVPVGVTPLPPFDAPPPAPFHPPQQPPVRKWAPAPLPPPRVTVFLPGGEVCLQKLAQAGVSFQPLDEIRGVETPIAIKSTIGGIRYHSAFGPMVSDCRFALALAHAAPELSALGVTEIGFSGAYSYRMSRVGRLSLHAYGLALDVHQIVVDGRRLSVDRDFARGIGCGVGPALNRVACRLRELGIFRELLTPDYNADHNDHFHLGVAPPGRLAEELWVKRPNRQPSPVKSGPVPTESKATKERHARKKPADDEPESKPKRRLAKDARASAERERERTEPRRKRRDRTDESGAKRSAKVRDEKGGAAPDQHPRRKRLKAAKRNHAIDKNGRT
jgi:hypothetical protein